MHSHCGTNNRAPRWTFTDPCKPVARPGAREESASPAWLAAPAMNARDMSVYMEAWPCMWTDSSISLAKDHWRGLNTRNAHMVHIFNQIRFKMVYTS